MKKVFNLILIFIILLTTTACVNNKEKTPVEVLDEVISNKSTVNPFEAVLSIDAKIVEEGMTLDIPLELSMIFDIKNEKDIAAILTLNENPFIGTQKIYVDINENSSNVYMQSSLISSIVGIEDSSNYWIKEAINSEDLDISFETEDIKELENINVKDLLTEKDLVLVEKGDTVNKYRLNITKDLLTRLQNALAPEEKETFEEFTGTLMVDLYIDTLNKRITKLEVDLGSFIKNLEIEETEDFSKDMIEKLIIGMEVKYENISVTIPNNVKNDAITTEDYINYLAGIME